MRHSSAALALALLLVLLSATASANSLVTHVWVAEQSIERVTTAPLRDIVGDPSLRSVIQNGALYSDSGYSVRHPYGEWAHWESFIEPYLAWIRGRWGAEGYRSPDARRHVAFLMGCAAHSMTDQTFDQYFMSRTRQYDRTDADDLDIASDSWLIVEHSVTSSADGRFWFDEMPSIHEAVGGPAVTPELLRTAAGMTAGASRILVRVGHLYYTQRWRQMPWSASHYFDAATPGSFPLLVSTTAAYWEFLWRRLNNAAADDAPPLYSWPMPMQANYPTDHTDIESRIVLTTAWGLEPGAANESTVRVLDARDAPLRVRVSRYGNEGNTVMVTPQESLAFNTAYRVEVSASVRSLAGRPIGRALVIPFRTRCAPDRLAECPALTAPTPTLAAPPVSDPQPPVGMGADAGPVVMVDDAGADVSLPMSRPAPPTAGCGCRARTESNRGSIPVAGVVLAWALRRSGRRARRGITARPAPRT